MTDDYKRGLVTGLAMQPLAVVDTEILINNLLTDYEYISDLSVRCNGVIYTVEKDANTGLITKISDSNGNEFKPTINSGITDVALHNAVFWAVAIARGINKTLTEQQFILNVCAKGDTANYPVMCYFMTDTKYQAVLLKSSYRLGLGLWRPIRNDKFAGISLEPSSTVYKVTDGVIDRWTDSPLLLASSNSSLGFLTSRHNTMYISAAPVTMHQFFSSWFEAGVELDIKSHPISFSDMFSFADVGAPTGAMYYKWNGAFFVDFYYNSNFAVLDGTNSRLDRSSTAKYADLSSYIPQEGYYHALGTSKVSVSCASVAQYGTSYYSTLRNNLEGNIFFNTEDICDENGNVLLAKNCDIGFFV